MKRQSYWVAGLTLACVLVVIATPIAQAGPPTEQLRTRVDQVIKTLESTDAAKTAERRAALRRIADEIFDFPEMAQRSLGQHWRARTPAEREEFTRLFTDLLEHAYMSKIERYNGERVSYVGESIEGDQATVRTMVVTKGGSDVPVNYRMHRADGRWLVYDVVIEGVSLISNYRTQFNKIIQTASYADLVARLKAKQFSAPESQPGKQG